MSKSIEELREYITQAMRFPQRCVRLNAADDVQRGELMAYEDVLRQIREETPFDL